MLNSQLQTTLIQLYSQIRNITSIEEVKEGYLSTNYIIVTGKNKYFLKQYRGRYGEEEIKDIHHVNMFFASKNIPTIPALKNINDNSYFIFDSKIYSLFPFVNGSIGNRDEMSKRSLVSTAQILAKLHLLSTKGIPLEIKTKQGPIDRKGFRDGYPKILEIIKSKDKKNSFDTLALKVLELKKSLVDTHTEEIESLDVIANHLLHGDFHEKNIFFDNDGNVKYIFDWEKTKIGNRLTELIRSMDFICLNGDYRKENINKGKLYIQTYKELYPFKKEAFADALKKYYLKKAHSLWIETTHYIENSNRVDVFLENELRLLEYYPSHLDTLLNSLGI